MTRDFIKFEEGNDTGDNLLESIAPAEAGDAANPQAQNRPLDVLRARTEALRSACDDALYLAAEDRALAITCPGGLHWGGPFPGGSVSDEDTYDNYTGRIGIGGDLHVVSLTTPNGTIFSSLQHTDILFTTRKTAADGGRQVSIEIEDIDDSTQLTFGLLLEVSGTPARHLKIQFNSQDTTPATVQDVYDALTDTAASAFDAASASLIIPEITGTAGNDITALAKVYLVPGWDFEYHIIRKGTLDAFFNIDGNRLLEGDNLCLRFNTLLDRRQALKDGAPSDGISVSPVADPNVTETALVVGRDDSNHLENAIPLAKVDGGNLVLLNGVPLKPGHFWMPEGAQYANTVSHTAREHHVRTVALSTFEVSGGTIPKRHLLRTYLNAPRKRALKGNVVIIAGGAYYVEGQHFIVDVYRDCILQLVEFASAAGNVYFRELPDTAENLGTNPASAGPPAALVGLDTRFFERHPDRDQMIDLQSAMERLVITAVTAAEAASLSTRIGEILGSYYSPIDTGRTVLNMGSLTGLRRVQAPTDVQTQYWQEHATTRANLWDLGGRIVTRKYTNLTAGAALTDLDTLVLSTTDYDLPTDVNIAVQEFGDNWENLSQPSAVDLATQIAIIQYGDAAKAKDVAAKWRAAIANGGDIAVGLTELRDYSLPVTVGPARTFGTQNATHIGADAATINAAVATARTRGHNRVIILPGTYVLDAPVDATDIEFIGVGTEDARPIFDIDAGNLTATAFGASLYVIAGRVFENINFAFQNNEGPGTNGFYWFNPASNADANTTLRACVAVVEETRRCAFSSWATRSGTTYEILDIFNNFGASDQDKMCIFRQISALVGIGVLGSPTGTSVSNRLLVPRTTDSLFVGLFMGIANYEGTAYNYLDNAEEGAQLDDGWETSYYYQALFGGWLDPDEWKTGETGNGDIAPMNFDKCNFIVCGSWLDPDDEPWGGTTPFDVTLGSNISKQSLSVLLQGNIVSECTFNRIILANQCAIIGGTETDANRFPRHGIVGIVAHRIIDCQTPLFGMLNGGATMAHNGVAALPDQPYSCLPFLCAELLDNRFITFLTFDDDTPIHDNAPTPVANPANMPNITMAVLDPAFHVLSLETPSGTPGAPAASIRARGNTLTIGGSSVPTVAIWKETIFIPGSLWLGRLGIWPTYGTEALEHIDISHNQVYGWEPLTDIWDGDTGTEAWRNAQASLVDSASVNNWEESPGGSTSRQCSGIIAGNTGHNLAELGLGAKNAAWASASATPIYLPNPKLIGRHNVIVPEPNEPQADAWTERKRQLRINYTDTGSGDVSIPQHIAGGTIVASPGGNTLTLILPLLADMDDGETYDFMMTDGSGGGSLVIKANPAAAQPKINQGGGTSGDQIAATATANGYGALRLVCYKSSPTFGYWYVLSQVGTWTVT